MRGLCAPTAPTARVASARALRGRGARRSPPLRAVSPRAQAASWGGDEGNKDEWRAHGKQIVEALTRGSSLARAASAPAVPSGSVPPAIPVAVPPSVHAAPPAQGQQAYVLVTDPTTGGQLLLPLPQAPKQ